jgi:long-chain acyl-CoA synthetase
MNLINFLENNVKKHPTKIAVIDEERNLSFKQLYDEVQRFSSNLNLLSKKNLISLYSENSADFIIAYLGIIKSGKIAHLVPHEISENNLLNQIKSTDSGAIICSSSIKKKITNYSAIKIPFFEFSELSNESETKTSTNCKINNLAYLIYTSGTTSEPKGVAISHKMIEFTTKNIIKVLEYSDLDVDVLPLPLYHSFGL